MFLAVLPEVLAVLMKAPELFADAQSLWQQIRDWHNAGQIRLAADQIAAMERAGVRLDDSVARLDADAAE